jgi:hypothetical protein
MPLLYLLYCITCRENTYISVRKSLILTRGQAGESAILNSRVSRVEEVVIGPAISSQRLTLQRHGRVIFPESRQIRRVSR